MYKLLVSARGDNNDVGARPLIAAFDDRRAALAARDWFREQFCEADVIYDGNHDVGSRVIAE